MKQMKTNTRLVNIYDLTKPDKDNSLCSGINDHICCKTNTDNLTTKSH